MPGSSAKNLRRFRDAVAIITGAASGIGAALSRQLHAQGATVILADRQVAAARELAESLGDGRAEAVELDVRDREAFDGLVADVVERHGRLDYLFNNAGLSVAGEILEHGPEEWQTVLDVNLMGVIHGVNVAYPRMVEQGFGHIVNTASMAGQAALPYNVAYTTTKHAVVGLSGVLRIEGQHYGVRASVLCPGFIDTAILDGGGHYGYTTRSVSAEGVKRLVARARPMDPDRFARKVLKQVRRNRATIVVPGFWWAGIWLQALAPGVMEWVGRRMFADAKREFEGEGG